MKTTLPPKVDATAMGRAFDEAMQKAKAGKASEVRMSVGNISRDGEPPVKTSGIKVRGTGAATKGVMARGPMA